MQQPVLLPWIGRKSRCRQQKTFYLSRILGNKVWAGDEAAGKLADLIVDVSAVRPRVIAVKLKMANKVKNRRFCGFHDFEEEQAVLHRMCEYERHCRTCENTLFLVKHVLDKQIVDMFGRKVVRVNDLRLAALSDGIYLVAADVGFEGLLRRLGAAKPLKAMLKPLGISIPSQLLLWDDVETIDFQHKALCFPSRTRSCPHCIHPIWRTYWRIWIVPRSSQFLLLWTKRRRPMCWKSLKRTPRST